MEGQGESATNWLKWKKPVPNYKACSIWLASEEQSDGTIGHTAHRDLSLLPFVLIVSRTAHSLHCAPLQLQSGKIVKLYRALCFFTWVFWFYSFTRKQGVLTSVGPYLRGIQISVYLKWCTLCGIQGLECGSCLSNKMKGRGWVFTWFLRGKTRFLQICSHSIMLIWKMLNKICQLSSPHDPIENMPNIFLSPKEYARFANPTTF